MKKSAFNSIHTGAITLLALVLLLSACGSNDKNDSSKGAVPTKVESKKSLAKIDSLEAIVYVDTFDFKTTAVSELQDAYARYIEMFPGDKGNTPKFLYKQAALYRASGKPVEAIKAYDHILTAYPGYELNPEVAFLLAFTYDDAINDLDQAKVAYQYVIDEYPGDKWAEQADARLKTIDMSDQELIDSFLKKNKLNGN